jgi:predicted nucleotidyltransferase
MLGERASREIWVCGPGAFVVLKALAFRTRGENKDAYDLYYVIRNYDCQVVDAIPLRARVGLMGEWWSSGHSGSW